MFYTYMLTFDSCTVFGGTFSTPLYYMIYTVYMMDIQLIFSHIFLYI